MKHRSHIQLRPFFPVGREVIKLGLTTDPPEALGPDNTLEIWITDDGVMVCMVCFRERLGQ